MAAKVFISCGQASAGERRVARDVERWFRRQGFKPYVAIQVQSLSDINSGIVGELKRSDFYVFIDFSRERLVGKPSPLRRGSLYTHQELAMACILDFEYAIFLRQRGLELNGLLRHMGSNAERFVPTFRPSLLVREMVKARRWDVNYTRQLADAVVSPAELRRLHRPAADSGSLRKCAQPSARCRSIKRDCTASGDCSSRRSHPARRRLQSTEGDGQVRI